MIMTAPFFPAASGPPPAATDENLPAPMRSAKWWLVLPFDALRAQYAGAVQAGFVERSLLASTRFEHAVAALEQFVLGPLARRK
jgi:hypothetical protein